MHHENRNFPTLFGLIGINSTEYFYLVIVFYENIRTQNENYGSHYISFYVIVNDIDSR